MSYEKYSNKKKNIYFCLLFGFIVSFTPFYVFADVVITEIMYDPKGSDTGHEWVEIKNNGTSPISVVDYRFFENQTNHTLNPVNSSGTLEAGAFAIIADDSSKFFTDFPAYDGLLIDSTFSLSNTGEAIAIKTKAGVTVDTVSYDPAKGGVGDGMSFQKISDNWSAGVPSPGKENVVPENTIDSSNTTLQSNSEAGVGGSIMPPPPDIYAYAGKDIYTLSGADTKFDALAWGKEKKPLDSNVRYIWNFGDGTTGEGAHVVHMFRYPGTYVVILDISSGYNAASSRLTVTVGIPEISVTSIGDTLKSYIEITNGSNREIDISGWIVKVGTTSYVFPEHSIILGKHAIKLSSEISKLFPSSLSDVLLFYPNNLRVNDFRIGSENTNFIEKPAPPSVLNVTKKVTPSFSEPRTEPIGKETYKNVGGTSSQEASVEESSGTISYTQWFLILLLVIGSAGVYFFMKRSKEEELVDSYEITEIHEL